MGDYNQHLADNDLKIDVEKSIQKQRLIYRFSAAEIFNAILSYLLLFIIVGALNAICISILLKPFISYTLIFLTILIDTLVVLNIILRDTLIRIEGNNIEENKTDILAVLSQYYPKDNFQIHEQNMLRSFKGSYQPIWGRIITVIFDGSTMYLNITKLGKSDAPTMIHGLQCYLKSKRIARYYKQHHL